MAAFVVGIAGAVVAYNFMRAHKGTNDQTQIVGSSPMTSEGPPDLSGSTAGNRTSYTRKAVRNNVVKIQPNSAAQSATVNYGNDPQNASTAAYSNILASSHDLVSTGPTSLRLSPHYRAQRSNRHVTLQQAYQGIASADIPYQYAPLPMATGNQKPHLHPATSNRRIAASINAHHLGTLRNNRLVLPDAPMAPTLSYPSRIKYGQMQYV